MGGLISQQMHKTSAHGGKSGHIHLRILWLLPWGRRDSILGWRVLVPLLVSTGFSRRPQHLESTTPRPVNPQFHTKQGSGHGSVTGNSSPSSPALGWCRQEGKEGTLAGSHKAQETKSTAGSRQLSREGLSTSNQ